MTHGSLMGAKKPSFEESGLSMAERKQVFANHAFGSEFLVIETDVA